MFKDATSSESEGLYEKIKTTFEIIFDVTTNLYIFLNFKSLAFLILNTFSK